MKKIIAIICMLSVFLNTLALSVSASEIPENNSIDAEPQSIISDDESPVYFSYDENKFQQNEIIPIKLKLKEASEANISYVTDGFEIISTSEASYGVDIQLKYTSSGEEASFSAAVEIGEDTYSASLSAISTNKGIFIASNTDAAMDLYLYSGVEDGEYSFEKYTELFAAYCNRANNGSITTSSISAENSTLGLSSTTVSGSLTWIDDSNVSHPVQYNKVELYSCLALDDPTNDSNYVLYGTAYTNINGTYSFTIPANAIGTSIFLKIYAGNQHCSVTTWGGAPYVWQTTKKHNISSGSNVTVNASITMSSSTGQAIQISQAVHVAAEYAKAMEGSYLPAVTVKYPHQNTEESGCYYSSSGYMIAICDIENDDSYGLHAYSSWDVIMHEYGHHVQAYFNITNNPGKEHASSEDLAETYGDKDIGIRLAWGEAYASVFSGMAQQYFASSLQNINTVGDANYTSYNRATCHYETCLYNIGEACEASIIGVLWDIYDSVSEDHDSISFSHVNYWNMITNSGATTMSEFAQYFNSTYPLYNNSFGSLLSHHGMAVRVLSYSPINNKISWIVNGMEYKANNAFTVIFYNVNGTEIMQKFLTSTPTDRMDAEEYILTSSDLSTFSSYSAVEVVVIAYQADSPITGGYRSAPIGITF